MTALSHDRIEVLKRAIAEGTPEVESVTAAVGGYSAVGGVWRFFSDVFPVGGIRAWNEAGKWKTYWGEPTTQIFAFGEDVFGNQLVWAPGVENVCFWDHEDGRLFQIEIDTITLLDAVLGHGLDWLDLYPENAVELGRQNPHKDATDSHLHWTTPLVFGGAVALDNISVVERTGHLVGHAHLWAQVRGLPPGSQVVRR